MLMGYGGGLVGVGLVFGVSLQGGLSAWVWDVWGLSKHFIPWGWTPTEIR